VLSSERSSHGFAAALVAAIALVANDAHGDAESDAKDLFERGRQLRAAGDCAGAAPLFHKANALYPSALGTLRNAAECEESLGRWASARRSWLDLKRALLVTQDVKYKGWQVDAEGAAERLAPRVAHLTIDISTGDHRNGDVEVTVNGEPLAATLVGTVLDRDPGQYVVRARRASGEPAEQTVELAMGEARVVALVVAARTTQSRPIERSSPWTPAGWVTISVGLGALVGMGVAIGVRQDALSTITSQCQYMAPKYVCSPAQMSADDRGNAASAVATVLAVAGGVITDAGLLMLVFGATRPHNERNVSLVLSPLPLLSGSF